MVSSGEYAAWSRISIGESKRFCKLYGAAHPLRLAQLHQYVANVGGEPACLDGTGKSLIWLWAKFLDAETVLPPEATFYSEHERKDVRGIQPGITSWFGLAQWHQPDPGLQLAFPVLGAFLSLEQVQWASYTAAYVVEMLSSEFPDVAWETHSQAGYPGERYPCFGGLVAPEQAVDNLIYGMLSGSASRDEDLLQRWYLKCRETLTDTPTIKATLTKPS